MFIMIIDHQKLTIDSSSSESINKLKAVKRKCSIEKYRVRIKFNYSPGYFSKIIIMSIAFMNINIRNTS